MLRSHLLHDSAPDESLAEKKDSDELESHNDDDYDAIASKALVRKQDLHLMPLAVWMYLLAYLDRSNIGNAKVLHKGSGHDLLTTLNVTEHQYTIALMLFFIAYILFETPSNWALKKFRPSRWISVIIFLWGTCTICLGSVQNFSQLAAIRFLLGATEAGLFPGLVTILTFWYRPEERTLRVALILASASFAGAFGGALATGISYMEGVSGLEAWRWLFILEGLPAILTAPIIYFCYPDWPETATWLTEEEKLLATKRLAGDNGSHGSHKMTWVEAKVVLTNWRLYFHYLAYIGISVPFSYLSLFTPTIVSNMGYDHGIQANLFSVPPYAVAWVLTVLTAYLADRYNARALATSVTACIGAIAFAVQGGLPEGHYVARYIVLIIATSGGFACTPPLLAWLSANVKGTTGATIAIPLSISCGGIGQIIGVWIFRANEAPRYPTGQFTNFAFLLMTCFVATGLQFWYRHLNRKIVVRNENEKLYAY